MKKRTVYTLIVIGALALSAVICVTVYAYMFRETETKSNRFTPAVVSCEVYEKTDDAVTEKTSVTVQNTSNIDAYLRVRLVSYWVRMTEDGTSEIVSKPSVMPEFQMADGWIAGKDNTYYYNAPVSPEGFTEELLSSPITLMEEDGCQQVIDIFAEAIQSKPASSVVDSWHVQLNDNDRIVSESQIGNISLSD